MLSGVLILVMCPKWVHKHLQKVAKNVFSLEKLFIDFLILLKETILHWFWWRRQFWSTALVNCVTGTEIFKIHQQPSQVYLIFFQNSHENTYARVSFLKKSFWHSCFSVNFVKFLRTPLLRATVSQNMKAYIGLYMITVVHSFLRKSCS